MHRSLLSAVEGPCSDVAERALVASVIIRAIKDLQLVSGDQAVNRREQIALDAKQWFADDEAAEEPFSFLWCCQQLGMDAAKIRDNLNCDLDKTQTIRVCPHSMSLQQKRERQQAIVAMHDCGASTSQIAARYGLKHDTIKQILRQNKRRSRRFSRDEIRELYFTQGLSLREIAGKVYPGLLIRPQHLKAIKGCLE